MGPSWSQIVKLNMKTFETEEEIIGKEEGSAVVIDRFELDLKQRQ